MVMRDQETAKVVVPSSRRKALATKVHVQLAHRGARKVLNVLRAGFIWPSMGSDVTRWLKACSECLLAKANKNLAHGMFRAVEFGQPGEAYGVDFYEVAMSECGKRIIMVVVDLFSRLTAP